MQYEITGIKPVSLAKITFLIGAVQGFIVVPMIISLTPGEYSGGITNLPLLMILIGIYGLFISFSGLISAVIYNAITSITGGLVVTTTEPAND